MGKLAKSNQEQAVASWINYLNQVRLNRLMEALREQDVNLERAFGTLKEELSRIELEVIERNRGGWKGMHGYIAEVAECGVVNAREQIRGRMENCEWINDNGPVDLIKDGIPIQLKFVQSGNHLSLQAVAQHLKKYPDYLRNGGKYQIPADHYEQIRRLLSIPREQAYKMPTATGEFSLKQWREVHAFFEEGTVRLQDLEPSSLRYDQVQMYRIHDTFQGEKEALKETDREIRKKAYDDSKPSIEQGVMVAAASAAIEGGAAFIASLAQKRKAGKKIGEFSQKDWEDVFRESGAGAVKGTIRGVSIYALTNYTATPAAVASSLCTASFGVAEQAHLLRTRQITEEQFLENAEILCLDTAVSALSSCVGHVLIPVPVLGAVIGNTAGTLLYQAAKEHLTKNEQELIKGYLRYLDELDAVLEKKYQKYIDELNEGIKTYFGMLERAFSPNYAEALEGSAALAISLGVPGGEVLKSIPEIDDYFIN